MNRIATLFAATILGTTCFTAVAHADRKTYSALECVAVGADQESYSENGRYYNTTDHPQTVVCPVINDKESSYQVSTTADVFVIDQSYTSDIDCRMFEHIGDWIGWGNASVSIGTSFIEQKLSSTLGGNVDIALYTMCHIPAPYTGVPSGIERYSILSTN
jgi:hypothetical protein